MMSPQIDISAALWWSFLNFLSIITLGFFSMEEMACVSFNKIRLHYYVSKGIQRAVWLNDLLQHPAYLFGTTLISVNAAMFIGSECARQTYLALGFNPDWAPITQVTIVIIFAELAPMFAARRYPEHVAMLGAPLLYATAKLMTPLLWAIGMLSKLLDFFIGVPGVTGPVVLNQEDLQNILAAQHEEGESESDEVNLVTRNIFSLRNKDALQIMQPLSSIPSLPSNATVVQIRKLLTKTNGNYVPIYHRDMFHIVGIALPRDLIRAPDSKRIRDYTSPPWFITQKTKVMQIIKEFRRNNQNVAVVLDDQGLAIGIITLEDLSEEVFGKLEEAKETSGPSFIIDRTFPGDMTVGEFHDQFEVLLAPDVTLTLAELMTKVLGHSPEAEESIYIAPFELTAKETSLMEVKKITVTTRIK